jgi:hypothetical protein
MALAPAFPDAMSPLSPDRRIIPQLSCSRIIFSSTPPSRTPPLLHHVSIFSAQQLAIDAAPAAVAAGDAAADAAGADAAEADAAAEEDMYALILKRRLLCRLAAAKHAEARRRCHPHTSAAVPPVTLC